MEVLEYKTEKVNENLTLTQIKDGLTFGSDAYLLYAYIKNHGKGSLGVDLGAGSGIISLLCASKGKLSKIYALEVQKEFSDLVKLNAENNSLSDKVISVNGDVCSFSLSDIGQEVDAVFSNPPYMKNSCGKKNSADRKSIARHEILATIDDFCGAAARILKFGGSFYVVYRPERLTGLFESMNKYKLMPKRLTFVCPDEKSRPCLVLVEAKKGGKEGIFITPPLIMHEDAFAKPLVDSQELKYIYENGEFDERYRKL